MKRGKFSFIALAAAGVLALSACSSDTPAGESTAGGGSASQPTATPKDFPEGSTMARLNEAGSIKIGTKYDQPLFGLKGPDGPEGFDVEIGKIIAEELGVTIDWSEAVSANREPWIENGTVDLVIATYTINDTRKEVVSFAGPYYMAGQSILVLANNDDIHGPDDLKGKPVCSVTGSTPAEKLREIGAEPMLTDAYSACLEPLRNGTAVAVSTDNVILAGLVAQNEGEFKVVGEPFTQEPYGIGLKKDDKEFRDWIDDVLEKSYEDGRYRAAWEKTAGTVLPYVDPPTPDRY